MDIYTYGDRQSDVVLLQMTDDHDQSMMEQEISCIKELVPDMNFQMITCKVDDWNNDLAPWEAPPVFGNEGFGSGASETLEVLISDVIPKVCGTDQGKMWQEAGSRHFILGGYSLAGLFALWAAYQTDLFEGIAAASPSVWFPEFVPYAKTHELHTGAIYLSLGDREEKTRSSAMSTVGDAIRALDTYYAGLDSVQSMLEWNKGNHFKEPERRTAKAFAWVMRSCSGKQPDQG